MATVNRELLESLNGPSFETLQYASNEIRELMEGTGKRAILVPTEYKERKTGSGLDNTSLFEAVKQGLPLSSERYRKEIDQLLLRGAPLKEKSYRRLVELIQTRPGFLEAISEFSHDPSSPLVKLIPALYGREVDLLETLYTFATSELLTERDTERENTLLSLKSQATQTLFGIYRTDHFEKIFSTPPDPLEGYLIALTRVSSDQVKGLVKGFGMLIPDSLPTVKHRAYALNWMPSYKKILTRKEPLPVKSPETFTELLVSLSTWTDQEIMGLGLPGFFDTRNALIDSLFRTFSQQGFLLLSELKEERTTNFATSLRTEVSELSPPFLVFGTPLEYRVLELQELVERWEEVTRGRFLKVGEDGVYSIAQVMRLSSILSLFSTVKSRRLERTIQRGVISSMRREAAVDELIRDLSAFNCSGLRGIFSTLFYLGMYLRGWKGPGNRYPKRGESGESIKTVLLRAQLLKQIESLDKKTLHDFKRVPGVEYQREAFALTLGMPLISRLEETETLISSGSYYSAVIFSEIHEGFSLFE